MKQKLPPTLTKAINRLASEEMRQAVFARGKLLRNEYAARLMAGESSEALEHEVQKKAITAAITTLSF